MPPYEPTLHDHLPLAKRANWLTLLSGRTVRWLGGAEKIEAGLRARAGDVTVAGLGGGALAVRAGAEPAPGDVERGEFLPAYRAVASAVRSVRLDDVHFLGEGFPDDRAQAWLEAFDRPVSGAEA